MGDDEMIGRLKAEIRARLKPVCLHMDDQMFEDLVEKVAMNEKRAIQRAGEKFGTPGVAGSSGTTIR